MGEGTLGLGASELVADRRTDERIDMDDKDFLLIAEKDGRAGGRRNHRFDPNGNDVLGVHTNNLHRIITGCTPYTQK